MSVCFLEKEKKKNNHSTYCYFVCLWRPSIQREKNAFMLSFFQIRMLSFYCSWQACVCVSMCSEMQKYLAQAVLVAFLVCPHTPMLYVFDWHSKWFKVLGYCFSYCRTHKQHNVFQIFMTIMLNCSILLYHANGQRVTSDLNIDQPRVINRVMMGLKIVFVLCLGKLLVCFTHPVGFIMVELNGYGVKPSAQWCITVIFQKSLYISADLK